MRLQCGVFSAGAAALLPFIGRIDVPWRAEVVARDEERLERSGALVRDGCPSGAGEQHRVAAVAAVARRDHVGARLALQVATTRSIAAGASRAVGEDDDRRLGLVGERVEPAAKRRSRPALPLRRTHDLVFLQPVRPGDDHDLVDGARGARAAREEQPLLRRAEPRRRLRRGRRPRSSPRDLDPVDHDRLRRQLGRRSPSAPMRSDHVEAARRLPITA